LALELLSGTGFIQYITGRDRALKDDEFVKMDVGVDWKLNLGKKENEYWGDKERNNWEEKDSRKKRWRRKDLKH
jgi:hypothetical protein